MRRHGFQILMTASREHFIVPLEEVIVLDNMRAQRGSRAIISHPIDVRTPFELGLDPILEHKLVEIVVLKIWDGFCEMIGDWGVVGMSREECRDSDIVQVDDTTGEHHVVIFNVLVSINRLPQVVTERWVT
uniref:Uncharacterized protein n=2 Tax=Cacopsylla melanoneura TaxID=428564 RepID=A0A8D8TQP2_9HEMI